MWILCGEKSSAFGKGHGDEMSEICFAVLGGLLGWLAIGFFIRFLKAPEELYYEQKERADLIQAELDSLRKDTVTK